MKISSWGRLSNADCDVRHLSERNRISVILQEAKPGLAFGLGRSYGDVCLNPGGYLWLASGLRKLINFDPESGILRCEAGVTLAEIQKVFLSRGWSLPVVPGTSQVTVGGAIANDVHGKNHHHFGSFGNHVRSLTLMCTTGETLVCSPKIAPERFAATIGGLGLTGVIADAEIQLRAVKGPWLITESLPYSSLKEFFDLADSSVAGWEYTVSWVDCSAGKEPRGIFMRANHTDNNVGDEPRAKRLKMLFQPPMSLVNGYTLRAFNSAYYHLSRWNRSKRIAHRMAFFHPLDNLESWNRMYGPRGFYQYQCVVPPEAGYEAIKTMLAEINRSGEGSFLSVLKTFGPYKARGLLSFPREGVTLAMDFRNSGSDTERLFRRLDAIVLEANGRIYPAKDARMPREVFEKSYPVFQEFCKYRDPGISSGLSRRLFGD